MSNQIEKISEIQLAYKKSGMWQIVKSAYTSKTKMKYLLWISSIIIIAEMPLFKIIDYPIISLLIFSLFLCVMYISFNKSLDSCFDSYNDEYKNSIRLHSKNRQFLRYLIFKEKVTQLNLSQEQIDSLVAELKLEPVQDSLSVIMEHPVTVACIAFLAAIIGGASGQEMFWTSGVLVYFIFILIVVIFFNSMAVDIFRSQKVKDAELLRFLEWLRIEG